MSGRANSIAAYNKIKQDGSLSKRRWEVYDALVRFGPATASELARHLPESPGGRGGKGNVHPRIGELIERGVARFVRDRACRVMGNVVEEYDVVDQLPVNPPPKPKTRLTKKCISTLKELHGSLKGTGRGDDRRAIRRVVEIGRERSK